jgi:hypothetical protein
MNPTDTIAKLRKLTSANGATPAEESRAAEKIGKLLMSHPDIAVGIVRESAPVQGRTRARATSPMWDHYRPFSFTADDLRKAQKEWFHREREWDEAMRERMKNGNPPEGWDAWIRARARIYD